MRLKSARKLGITDFAAAWEFADVPCCPEQVTTLAYRKYIICSDHALTAVSDTQTVEMITRLRAENSNS